MAQQQRKTAFQAWFDPPEVAQINKFRRDQDEIPSIANSIRQLVKRGLAATANEEERGAA